jgi:hypothetical protein
MRNPSDSAAVATSHMYKDTTTTISNNLHGARLRPARTTQIYTPTTRRYSNPRLLLRAMEISAEPSNKGLHTCRLGLFCNNYTAGASVVTVTRTTAGSYPAAASAANPAADGRSYHATAG